MSGTISDRPGPIEGVVAPDILCRACAYELKGIGVGAACPECGTPVASSLRGDMLEGSSPRYVRGLWLGALLAEISVPLMMLAWFLVVPAAIALAERAANSGGSAVDANKSVLVLQGMLTFVLAAVSLAGWWLLTQPDQGYAAGAKDIRARRLLRSLVLIRAAGALLGLVVIMVPAVASSPFAAFTGNIQVSSGNKANTIHNPTWWLAIGLRGVFLGVFVLQFLVACRFLQALAARVPSARAAKHAGRAAWAIPLGWTVGWLACALGPPAALGYYVWLLDLTRRELRGVLRAQQGEREPSRPAIDSPA